MEQLIDLLKEVPKFGIILNAIVLYLVIGILQEVRKTNGRVIRLEAWKDAHDKQDDDRHKELMDRLKEAR